MKAATKKKTKATPVANWPPPIDYSLDAEDTVLENLPPPAEPKFTLTGEQVKDFPAGTIKRIHVNKQALAINKSYIGPRSAPLPVVLVHFEDGDTWVAFAIEIAGPSQLVYQPENPIYHCGDGTVAWVETTAAVRLVIAQ